jgi:drug/metabolite transporter (DMT)-like permease
VTIFLYVFCLVVWGLNAVVIRLQGSELVPAEWALAYRLVAAGLVFVGLCVFVKPKFNWKKSDRWSVLLFGFLNFFSSYLLFYFAADFINAALITLIFSMKVIITPLFLAVFLRQKVQKNTLIGGVFGVAGVAVLAYPLFSAGESHKLWLGCAFALGATVLTALGDVCSARNAQKGIHPLAANAVGMSFAAVLILGYATFAQGAPSVSSEPNWLLALAYLTFFSTVLAWLAYLQLITRIGAAKSAYMVALFPMVAGAASVWIGDSPLNFYLLLGCTLSACGAFIALKAA